MAFNVGSVVAKITADVSEFQEGIKKAKADVSSFGDGVGKVVGKIQDIGRAASVLTGVAGAGLAFFLKDSAEQAAEFTKAMTTLDIIAERFGESGEKAQQSAKDLGRELRIGPGAAADALQNLLKSGLGLDQASDLLKRFTNEAMTGKSANISLSEAVKNLSFSYATNNSAIGNLSGISENYVDIIKRGKDALIEEGVAVGDITDDMAKYKGMIELTNLTMGSAERFAGSYIDKQAQLQQKIDEIKVSIGSILIEALTPFITKFAEWADGLAVWVENNKEQIKVWADQLSNAAVTVLGWIERFVNFLINNKELVLGFFAAIGLAIGVFVAGLIIANAVTILIIGSLTLLFTWLFKSKDAIIAFALEIKARFEAIGATVTTTANLIKAKWEDLLGRLGDLKNKMFDAITWPFTEAKKKIEGVVNWIKDNLDFTKRHSPSVVDIVNKGVREVNKALDGLNFGVDIMPKTAVATSIAGPNASNMVNQIHVDLAGAFIGNETVAEQIGEQIGDSIIRKLQLNIRF